MYLQLCFIFVLYLHVVLSSPGEVLQMHFPSVTIAAQENGDLTAESGEDGNIHINPGNGSGTVTFEGNDLIELIEIINSLPPVWVNHSEVGFVGTFEGGRAINIPLHVLDPSGSNIKLTVVAGDLPPGVHIDLTNKKIVGIAPDQDAQYVFTIRATGDKRKFADAVFKIETIELQHCLYTPCQNGATCNETNVGKGYECECASTFGGHNCDTDCRENEVGVESPSRIPDAQMTAYLSHEQSNATDARLSREGKGWCGENANSWLQIDLGNMTKVVGVSMYGYNMQYKVDSYQISYSSNGHNFTYSQNGTIPVVYQGRVGSQYSKLQEIILARFIRLHPYSYNAQFQPCFKVELYGCVL